MKLFRRTEPKTSHPHAAALSHLSNAHRALMKENMEEARQHLGRAFAAVHHAMPKPAKPDTEPDTDDTAPNGTPSPTMQNTTSAFARLRGMNQQNKQNTQTPMNGSST